MKRYTEEQLIEAVKTSTSIRQVLSKLNIVEAGGNYQTIKKNIKKLKLDTTHMKGQVWNKGKITGPKRMLDDYVSNKYPIHSYKLKNRLLKEKIFDKHCYSCDGTTWLGLPMPLELHHKDGNNNNNNLDNLSLLCPNCHALTDNYRSKNRKINTYGGS